MKNINAKFSIIIPSFNSIKTIGLTIDSILMQNNGLVEEIIIVDSSENDEVFDYLKSLNNQLIKSMRSGVRIMPAIQRNVGAREARGEILLFLDSDVILLNGYLEKIRSVYNDGKRVGGGAIMLPDFQLGSRIAIAQYYLQLNEFMPGGKSRTKKCIPGCNIFCERELFFKAGCFPEIRASEDTQFCYNIKTISDIWFIPEAKIAHIFREDKKSFQSNQELLGNYIGRNKKTKFDLILKTPLLHILFPVILIMKLLIIFFRISKVGSGHFNVLLKNIYLIIIGLFYWTAGFTEGYKSAK